MIEPLASQIKYSDDFMIQTKTAPDNYQLMQKINEIIEHMNRQEENEPHYTHIMSDVACCPHCGHNEYSKIYSSVTLMNIPEEYKDGVLIESPIKNETTATYQCLRCGYTWDV